MEVLLAGRCSVSVDAVMFGNMLTASDAKNKIGATSPAQQDATIV
ncbi:MAG: hypothetical protein ACKVG0_04195 [Alphaproteobacteria bacterium]|jgi:hypothetical protein